MKFTAKSIAALKLPEGKIDHLEFDPDNPGLGLRLRAGGSRMWIYQYALGSKQRRVTLGRAEAMTLGKARERASEMHAKVRLGHDPANEKAEGRKRAAETFEAVGERFLAYQRHKLRPGSYLQVERHMLKHARPLHGLQLAAIDKRAIAARLSAIAEQKGKVTANRVRGTLSTFFAWSLREGLLDANPVINTNKFEETSRSRVLSDGELALIWRALGTDHFSSIMKLLALTGCRAGEIAGLRWAEIGEDAITFPPERTKNGRQHLVPLSNAAFAIIAAQPRRTNSDGTPRALVFGTGQGGFCGWDNCMRRLNEAIAAANGAAVPHWTPHDLRRTCRTKMAELKVPPHIAEAVLNHAGHLVGVGAIYDRWTYEPEKRQALVLWSDHLMAVVEGRASNVVTLRA